MVGKSHIGKSHTRQIPTQPNFHDFFDDKFRVSELVFGSDGEQDKVRPKI